MSVVENPGGVSTLAIKREEVLPMKTKTLK